MNDLKILSIDPSLRNTGMSLITYDRKKDKNEPSAYKISYCQVLRNPSKYTKTDAILNMLDMMQIESKKPYYASADIVLIESPPIAFYAKNMGVISALAHVAGGAVAIFGIGKSYLYKPSEWNRSKNKEVTHAQTLGFLGDYKKWHYEAIPSHERFMEHIIDAISMGLWHVKNNMENE